MVDKISKIIEDNVIATHLFRIAKGRFCECLWIRGRDPTWERPMPVGPVCRPSVTGMRCHVTMIRYTGRGQGRRLIGVVSCGECRAACMHPTQ